jgi:hypothetical protein
VLVTILLFKYIDHKVSRQHGKARSMDKFLLCLLLTCESCVIVISIACWSGFVRSCT